MAEKIILHNLKTKFRKITKRIRWYTWAGIGLIVVMLPIVIFTFWKPFAVEAEWFNEAWTYRKEIPVTNNTTTETDKFISFDGTAGHAYLDTSDTNKFQVDCGDIRFTKENGELLPYYIQSGCGTSSTDIDVYFDSFPAGSQNIYMYYGNPSTNDGFESQDFSAAAGSGDWLTGWDKRIEITVSNTNIDSDLTHFPLLLTLGTSVGTGNDDISAVFDELTSDANRKKIAVTKSDGTTEIYAEIEKWDDANEQAWLWVSKDDLTLSSSGTTTLYLYYDSSHADNSAYVGDPDSAPGANVWDSNYLAVYHLEETTTGSTDFKDSTSNDEDSTSVTIDGTGSDPDASGPIDGAVQFDGSDDQINIPSITLGGDTGSIELWANFDVDPSTNGYLSAIAGNSNSTTISIHNDGGYNTVVFRVNGEFCGDYNGGEYNAGTDYHIVSTYDGTNKRIYADSSLEATCGKTGNWGTSAAWVIGNGSDAFNGFIDEARLSSTTRSAAWIKASYHSESDNLVSWSTEETVSDSKATNYTIGTVGSEEIGPGPAGWWKFDEGYGGSEATNWLAGWDQRIEITVSNTNIDSDLTHFPLLLTLGTSVGTGNDDVSAVFDELTSDANRKKIAVTKSDGTTEIYAEIEKWDDANEQAWLWVSKSDLILSGSENTTLYLYYDVDHADNTTYVGDDNSTAGANVWDSSFEAVHHLEETTTGSTDYKDSTSNDHDSLELTIDGAGSDADATGNVDGANQFDGTDDYIGFDNYVLGGNTGTLEGWVNADTITAGGGHYMLASGYQQNAIAIANDGGGNYYTGFRVGGSNCYDSLDTNPITKPLSTGSWYYVVGIADGTDHRIYVNGDLAETCTEVDDTFQQNWAAGNWALSTDEGDDPGGYYVDGYLDEMRQSTTARSAAWIKATYNSNNDNLVSWGSEEANASNYAHDATINSNDAALSGAAWQEEGMCIWGKCLFFDGSDDVATVTNANSIDLNNGLSSGVTFSTWVRVNSDGEGNAGEIFDKDGGAGTPVTYLRVTNEGSGGLADLEASLDLATTPATKTVTNGITLNQWHHVAMTYSDDGDDEITVYIDGISQGSSTNGAGAPDTDTYNLLIGGSTSNNFHGFIDEFKIYPYERSASQIKVDYVGGTAVFKDNKDFLTDGLVGYWKMDEESGTTVSDGSGNGNDGTAIDFNAGNGDGDTPPVVAAGKFGNSRNFDGTDDYIRVLDGGTNDPLRMGGNQNISYGGWVYIDNLASSSQHFIVSKYDFSAQTGYSLKVQSTGAISMDINGSTNAKTTSSTPISAGKWYHIVGIFRDGNTMEIYVNGELEESFPISDTSLSAYTGTSAIGEASDNIGSSTYTIDGSIDDLRVYNRALSPGEVQALYNWAPGPILQYLLDENTGTTSVNDSSGNGNSGTINGTMTENDWVPGKYGSALNFDGSDDALTVATASDGDVDFNSTEAFSGSAWVYVDTMPGSGNQDAIMAKWDETSTLRGYRLVVENDDADSTGNFQVEIYDESANQNITASGSNDTVSEATWYHVAFTFSGGTAGTAGDLNLYTNGTLTASNTLNASFLGLEDVAVDFTVANYDSTDVVANNTALAGILDDIRIYNYTRAPQQIVADMNGGHPTGGSPIGSQVSHWKFDEMYGDIAYDSVNLKNGDIGGSGEDCTDGGTTCPTWIGSGKTNSALSFDGGDFVTNTSVPSLLNSMSEGTISLWFARDNTSTGSLVYLGDSGTSNNLLRLSFSGSTTLEVLNKGAASDNFRATVDLGSQASDGSWNHLAWTVGSNGNTLYFNGQPQTLTYSQGSSSSTEWLDDISNEDLLVAGAHQISGSYASFYDGSIDEVNIYSSALTENQVKIDMNQGSAASYGVMGTKEAADLEDGAGNPPVGYWPMDENTGTSTTYDKSGNGNDGALTSITESSWVPGKNGSALELDGSADFVDIGSGPGTVRTISMWVNPTTTSEHIIDLNGSDYLSVSSGTLDYTGDASETIYVNGVASTTLTANTWQHIAVVLSANDNASDLDIGRLEGTDFLSGKIDEVKLFDYALTQAQVIYDYNRGGPMGWWKFDECEGATAYDSSGNGNNGTINPGDTSGDNDTVGTCGSGTSTEMWNDGTTGKRNASLGFDGTNDKVVTDSSVSTSPYITVSAWVNPSSLPTSGNLKRIVTKYSGSGSTNGHWVFDLQNSSGTQRIRYIFFSSSTPYGAVVDHTLPTSTWTHLAVTFDGDVSNLYVNGNLIETDDPTATAIPSATQTIAIGEDTSQGSGAEYFAGQIDDVRIYNYALSANQVKKVMNESAVRFGPDTGSP